MVRTVEHKRRSCQSGGKERGCGPLPNISERRLLERRHPLRLGERILRQLLLIDDEPAFGRFIAHAAEAGGYAAHVTLSAEPFMQKYRELRPDAVTVDLAMPQVDGVELLRFLAEEKCAAPVIIVSGFDRRVLESSMRLGAALGLNMVGPLEKPVRLQEFLDLLAGLEHSSAA